jgi:hypothetical protein
LGERLLSIEPGLEAGDVGASVMSDNAERKRPQVVKRVPCEVYSRIVGYLRPVQAWNEGKQQEFRQRETYDVEQCLPDKEHTPAT